MVFIPSYIKLSVEENEETFSDVFVQINTFLEAYMLFFLERGSLTEMFSAHRGGQNNSENYHLRGNEPFHLRDTFNINTLFVPHVSNVPE